MITFTNSEQCGFLPHFFREEDPRSAEEQLDESYAHGGGYHPLDNFTVFVKEGEPARLVWADPAPDEEDRTEEHYEEVARAQMRDQTLILFELSFLAIIGPNGVNVCRVD